MNETLLRITALVVVAVAVDIEDVLAVARKPSQVLLQNQITGMVTRGVSWPMAEGHDKVKLESCSAWSINSVALLYQSDNVPER